MTDHQKVPQVFGGVDTHALTHHAAVVDVVGGELADREFPATPTGYEALRKRMTSFGELAVFGVEGTGSYGAGLNRVLAAASIVVVEVDRPDRSARRAHGKSDPLDAYAAARAAASGRAAGTPTSRDGIVESIRCLRVALNEFFATKDNGFFEHEADVITGPRRRLPGSGPATPSEPRTHHSSRHAPRRISSSSNAFRCSLAVACRFTCS